MQRQDHPHHPTGVKYGKGGGRQGDAASARRVSGR